MPFVYYNYVDPTVYTYGPCESYDSNVSYACVGGTQNQATTITYRRRQILANGTWNGSYEQCTSTSSTTGSQYTDGVCGYTAPPPCSISSYSGWSYSSITWSGNCVLVHRQVESVNSGLTQCEGIVRRRYIAYGRSRNRWDPTLLEGRSEFRLRASRRSGCTSAEPYPS